MNELVNVNVRIENEQMITDSRNVADVFGKQHKHVLDSIRTIQKDVPNFWQMFFEGTMPDSYGREQKVYFMSRDGFTLLAMGFTGSEAMQWKVKYIEAFNKLESFYNSPEQVMARALKIANYTIDSLQMQIEMMQPKVDYFDDLVDRKLNTTIRNTAKEIGIKQKKFVDWLLSHKFVFRENGDKLRPFAKYAESGDGLFTLKDIKSNVNNWAGHQMYVTPKGKETFRLLLEKEGLI